MMHGFDVDQWSFVFIEFVLCCPGNDIRTFLDAI